MGKLDFSTSLTEKKSAESTLDQTEGNMNETFQIVDIFIFLSGENLKLVIVVQNFKNDELMVSYRSCW